MAEVLYLQSNPTVAKEFWEAFKNTFCSLFIDGEKSFFRDGPPHGLQLLVNLAQRVREAIDTSIFPSTPLGVLVFPLQPRF